MAEDNILNRPATSPDPPPAGSDRGDGNPYTNARGQYLAAGAHVGAGAASATLAQALMKLRTAQAATVAARAALATEGGAATADLADDWNPTGWVIDGAVGAAALYSLYQLHQATKAVAAAQQEVNQAQQEQTQAQAGSGSTTNVNTPGEDPCKTDPYKDKKCPDKNEAHHIVQDMVLRYGVRGSDTRIPNAPTLNEGLAICLDEDEHDEVHRIMNAEMKKMRADPSNGSQGTAPMNKIVDMAIDALEQVKPGCKSKFGDVQKQFEHMGDQPGRITPRPPKVGSPGQTSLESGGAGNGSR